MTIVEGSTAASRLRAYFLFTSQRQKKTEPTPSDTPPPIRPHLPILSQTVLPTRKEAFKYTYPRGPFSLKPSCKHSLFSPSLEKLAWAVYFIFLKNILLVCFDICIIYSGNIIDYNIMSLKFLHALKNNKQKMSPDSIGCDVCFIAMVRYRSDG